MVDIAALVGLIPGITAAVTEMARTSNAAKRNAQLIDFQNTLIQLQSGLFSVPSENASLV